MTLSASGFSRKRLMEIKTDYDQRFSSVLGPVNTSADSVTGQIIGIFSAALDDVWESLQNTYDAMYPYSAEGLSLDGAVSFVGLRRFAATPTTVIAMCYGTEGAVILAGSLARANDNSQYVVDSDVIIGRAVAGDVNVEVTTLLNSTMYSVQLSSIRYEYTSSAAATKAEIVAGLAALVDAAAAYSATATGDVLSIQAQNKTDSFSIGVDVNLSVTKLGTPAPFTAAVLGKAYLPIGSLNRMDTSVAGWTEVRNLVAGTVGRDVETDEQLRIRHATQSTITGTATVNAIISRLKYDIPGVTAAQVYENRSDLYVGVVPPHSIECVVQGGDDQAIADKIFWVKPAGIETYGAITRTVIDPNGEIQECKFSRPVPRYAWFRVTIQELYTEEILPATAETSISNAIIAAVGTLVVGKDLIPQRFYAPIFASTPGLAQMLVEVALTESPVGVPVYGTDTLPVERASIVVADAARITVLGL